MAATQQLTRVDKELLQQCRQDVTLLVSLVSFELLPKTHYLDLCWAPAGLNILAKLSGQTYDFQAALMLACEGIRPVNRQFPLWEVAEFPFELSADEVKKVVSGISGIESDSLVSAIPETENEWNKWFGFERPENAILYYGEYFTKLRTFYTIAGERNQCVVVWSD